MGSHSCRAALLPLDLYRRGAVVYYHGTVTVPALPRRGSLLIRHLALLRRRYCSGTVVY